MRHTFELWLGGLKEREKCETEEEKKGEREEEEEEGVTKEGKRRR